MRLRTTLPRHLLALALGVGTLAALAPPASAAAQPVVVSPASGETVGYGSATPIVIDFPEAGFHTVTLACGSGVGTLSGTAFQGSVPAGRKIIDIGELVTESETGGGATCEVRVAPPLSTSVVTSTFAVAAPPPLDLKDPGSSKRTFYPLVEDGHLDDVTLWHEVNRIVVGETFTVKDSKGRTILAHTFDEPFIGRAEWPWAGTTKGGKPVLPGKYDVTISATALDGTTRTHAATVRVATKAVTRRKKVQVRQAWRGSYSSRGECGVRSRFGRGTAVLDCQGQGFAAVTYGFKVPPDARKVRFGARTQRTEDDLYRGSITTRGTRAGRTRFEVEVKVTDQRSVEVFDAWVSYVGTYQI